MIRVYIDTNVFSKMRNKMDVSATELEQYLKERKDFLFPVYSRAHIDDLKNDFTDQKFKDTAYMEDIVGHYCFYYDAINKKQLLELVSPTECLKAHLDVDPTDLSGSFNEFDETSFGQALDKILDTPIPIFNLPNIDEKYKDTLANFIPIGKEQLTIRDFLSHTQELLGQLQEKDNPLYKNTRRMNIDELKLNQTDSSYSIDEILKKSPFGKSLSELIEANSEDMTMCDFFTKGFVMLNMLALDKEKNNKANFVSMSNDSQHSYYASFCDYFITEDKGLVFKSRELYNLKKIRTEVLSPSEFLQKFNLYNPHITITITTFLTKLVEMILDKKPENEVMSEKFNRLTKSYVLDEYLFDYFNSAEVIQDADSGTFIILSSQKSAYWVGLFYNEIELLTNKLFRSFGEDLESLSEYSEIDQEQIKKSDWSGRLWSALGVPIAFEINKGTNKLSLCIGPIAKRDEDKIHDSTETEPSN